MRNLRSFLIRMHHSERGQTILVFALMFVVLLGFTAMVSDAGIAYWNRRLVQNGVDSAALAGAVSLNNGSSVADVKATAVAYANANGVTTAEINNVTDPKYQIQVGQTFFPNDTVIVSADRKDSFGLRYVLVGGSTTDIQASAAAIIAPVNPDNLWPIGIWNDPSVIASCYSPTGCTLKTGAGGSSDGNFGYVQFPGMGGGNIDVTNAMLGGFQTPVPAPTGTATPPAVGPGPTPPPEVYGWSDPKQLTSAPGDKTSATINAMQTIMGDGNPNDAVTKASWDYNELCEGGKVTCSKYYVPVPQDGNTYNPIATNSAGQSVVCISQTVCPRVGIVPLTAQNISTLSGNSDIQITGFGCFYLLGTVQYTDKNGKGQTGIQGRFLTYCTVSGGQEVVGGAPGSTGENGVFLWR
ncbi:MAG TPA: TadE/TadG family type IV pilus assembly protein [Chloroflexota bacterium]|nr:TadE/TadG family type IV pilus assembly protein [Chloroflexota bacterium]